MMPLRKSFILVLTFAGLFAPTLTARATLTNAAALARALHTFPVETNAFDLTARATTVLRASWRTSIVAFGDASGTACAYGQRDVKLPRIKPGDLVRFVGVVEPGNPPYTPSPYLLKATVLAHGPPPVPRRTTVRAVAEGRHDWQLVRLRGLVRDVFPSETSDIFATLTLADDGLLQRVCVSLADLPFTNLVALVGREVEMDGFPNLNAESFRAYAGREFHCPGRAAIRARQPPPADPFDVPELETLMASTIEQIAVSGFVRTRGLVLCTWGGESALVQTPFADIVRLDTPYGKLPPRGACIEVVGLPQSDSYHITLTHIRWRRAPFLGLTNAPAEALTADKLMRTLAKRTSRKAGLHGQPMSLSGRIRSLPNADDRKDVILLENDGTLVPVDVSNLSALKNRLALDSHVRIHGTYVMEAEYWRPGLAYPQITGFRIVLDDADGLVVLSRPTWWTTGRLLSVIAALLAVLAGIAVWNAALRRAAKRKGLQLMREQLQHVKADLRTEERTRLATELHDTLAQNLTGVSMEIEAAHDLHGNAPRPMLDHLGIAAKALKSCRDELRNNLWDLRSQALEEPDLTTAIRRTLQPCVSDSHLSVRFNVPRARLSDNTAHTLLRVIRELAVNAFRHGQATSIRIAGALDSEGLRCSVTDNGQGFDPQTAPGALQGHFGLQGIRERIAKLGGTFCLDSAPGRGTRATINLPPPSI